MAIDKTLVAQRFSRALPNYTQHAVAQQQINQKLLAMLRTYSDLHFDHALEIGCGAGNFSRELVQQCCVKQWIFNDLSEKAISHLRSELGECPRYLIADGERLEANAFPKLDLIVSGSTVQWFQHPHKFIHFAENTLNRHAFLLFNTFLPENLHEIRTLTGRGLAYPTEHEWRRWLADRFEILALDSSPLTLLFDSPLAVLAHLKHTGVTATSATAAWTKSQLRDFIHTYQQRFAQGEQVPLTYAPLLILAKRK